MSADVLKQKLKDNPTLNKKLMFQNANIQGTRPFWFARSRELVAMVEQLNLPTLFFTLSAADLHWPDLFRILAPDKEYSTLSERDRWKLVQDNPMIVDSFFSTRVKTYIDEVHFNYNGYFGIICLSAQTF